MTAEDINEFLAHSDGESSDSSDWNDVKEEAEEGEEVESCRIGGATPCTVSTPSPIPQTARGSLDIQVHRGLPSYCHNLFIQHVEHCHCAILLRFELHFLLKGTER